MRPAGARMSLIDESGERYVRMANLATVGSHRVNGVAALHTELLKRRCCTTSPSCGRRSSTMSPTASPRAASSRSAIPPLAELITDRIGDGWLRDLEQLRKLEPLADDAGSSSSGAR